MPCAVYFKQRGWKLIPFGYTGIILHAVLGTGCLHEENLERVFTKGKCVLAGGEGGDTNDNQETHSRSYKNKPMNRYKEEEHDL